MVLLAASLLTASLAAQQKERSAFPTGTSGTFPRSIRAIRRGAPRRRSSREELPAVRAFKGTLGSSPQKLADALELTTRLSKDFSRIYVYASMMSDEDTRVSTYQGMQQEMAQLGAKFGAETSFVEPEILKIDRATIDKFVAGEPRLRVYKFYLDDILRRREHTLTDAEERLLASSSVMASAPSDVYGILSNADFPFPIGDARGREERQARQLRLQPLSRRAEPRRSREGHERLLRLARRVPRHVRLDPERPGPVGRVLREVPELQERARGGARRREHSDLGLHAARRRREPQSPDVPPLPEPAQAHDGALGAALLRSVRAARLVSRSQLHRGRGAEARARRARPARRGLRRRRDARLLRALDRHVSDSREALGRLLERRRVRRPSVHAAELQRQVQRRQHARARARPRDALVLLEQDPALCARQLPDLRRRGRLDVQRGAPQRPHAEDDHGRLGEAVAAGELPRGDQGHRVPADAVRGVRAARRTRWRRRASR